MKVTCPFRVHLPRKTKKDKQIPINLNWYRNAQHFESNQAKKQFLEDVRDQLEGKRLQTPVTVCYQVFKPTRRRLDKMNVVAITSKFLLDALSELGVWVDDNDDYVKTEIILPTEHDKDNARVEVTLKTIKEI
tara:strand:+ start:706 stop:1104 length:399 start_codon:yes stop_codon:yes gene_type:complete